MTREDALRQFAIKQLIDCKNNGDTEGAHIDADEILCGLLSSLGYSDVVAEWNKIKKWYA